MPFSYMPTAADWGRVAPELVIVGGGLLLLVADLVLTAAGNGGRALLALAVLLGGLAATITLFVVGDSGQAFAGMVSSDWLALTGDLVILSAGVLAVLLSPGYIERQEI